MSAPAVAVIGGSGFYQLDGLAVDAVLALQTPFGEVTGLQRGRLPGLSSAPCFFMCRHGAGHKVPPHRINYRANLWALYEQGVRQIIAVNAVGGLVAATPPGALVIPDQLIDYTAGREHTYADPISERFNHVEFAEPYSAKLRGRLLQVAHQQGIALVDGGCYGCTQGPRLETAAEIQRLIRDGNTLVGMTAMPEAALARELGMQYAAVAVVANWGAGLAEPIAFEAILAVLEASMQRVQIVVAATAQSLAEKPLP